MSEKLLFAGVQGATIQINGYEEWCCMAVRNGWGPVSITDPDHPAFFLNQKKIDNSMLGLKVYEYLSLYKELPNLESYDDKNKRQIKFVEETYQICASYSKVSLKEFSAKKFAVLIEAAKDHVAIVAAQRLIEPCFRGIPRISTRLEAPVDPKELGYWVKEGLNRCFIRGNYKIPKSKGMKIKYNRRLEIVSPKELPEGIEPILPKNPADANRRTALVLYLKNGLLGFHKNIFYRPVYADMMDPYAKWGFVDYAGSDKELGERVHRSLLMLDPPSGEQADDSPDEEFIEESQQAERLFFDEMKGRLGITSDEELFEGMLCCHPIELQQNYLVAPTRRIKFKEFAVIGKRYVVENVYCTASELGAAVREGFRRSESAPLKDLPTLINYDENP